MTTIETHARALPIKSVPSGGREIRMERPALALRCQISTKNSELATCTEYGHEWACGGGHSIKTPAHSLHAASVSDDSEGTCLLVY